MLSGTPLTVSVAAEEDVRAAFLDFQRMLAACPSSCPRHSRLLRNLLAVLAEKNLSLNEKLTHMGQRTTRDKLLSYLSAQARRQGSPRFRIPFSRQQLADYLCVDRSGLSAELGRAAGRGNAVLPAGPICAPLSALTACPAGEVNIRITLCQHPQIFLF